jgi:hypothetical protein
MSGFELQRVVHIKLTLFFQVQVVMTDREIDQVHSKIKPNQTKQQTKDRRTQATRR